MDSSAVKESRTVLRQVQEHLLQAHLGLGAQVESAGMVDVLYCPSTPSGALNYVMPRRNTAWVSASYVELGLKRLRELGRRPRFQYIEGLFPPQFGETLARLGLEVRAASPLLVYRREGVAGVRPPRPANTRAEDVRIRRVTARRGATLWAAARDARWDTITLGAVPLTLNETGVEAEETAFDLVAYHKRAPVAILRVATQPENGTAHFVALALRRDRRPAALMDSLVGRGLRACLRQGCDVILAGAQAEADRAVLRAAGFAELGRMIAYAGQSTAPDEGSEDGLEQPVFALR